MLSTKIVTRFGFTRSCAQPVTAVLFQTQPSAFTGTKVSTPGSSTAHDVPMHAGAV